MGKREEAIALYKAIQRFQLDDGGWWTGYVFPDDVHWPDEPTDSWRGAAGCRRALRALRHVLYSPPSSPKRIQTLRSTAKVRRVSTSSNKPDARAS